MIRDDLQAKSLLPDEWFTAARRRIAAYIEHTPLLYDGANDLFLKLESLQVTGSFKARGAFNKVLCLQEWERAAGLVAASAGNHGQGLALAGKLTGSRVTVFAPQNATPIKLQAIERAGAQLHLVPGGYPQAEREGKLYAASSGSTWVSPYNDGQVIAGQGTIALETLDDLPDLSRATWIVPVGGGGLVSGIASALYSRGGGWRIVGVQAQASPFFHALFYRGSQQNVQESETLAEGLAGEIEHNSLTIPLVRRYVDDIVLVNEEEILQAIAYAWGHYGESIEPSAAAALAAALSGKIVQRPAVVVISGGNIQPELHAQICLSQPAR